ncbi:MAG: hypothetical protein AAGF07_02290 [Patescibacteria group bacterium]
MSLQKFVDSLSFKLTSNDKEVLGFIYREIIEAGKPSVSTKEIADGLSIAEGTCRQRLSKLYQKFGIQGKGPVKTVKLIHILKISTEYVEEVNYFHMFESLIEDGKLNQALHLLPKLIRYKSEMSRDLNLEDILKKIAFLLNEN